MENQLALASTAITASQIQVFMSGAVTKKWRTCGEKVRAFWMIFSKSLKIGKQF